MKINGVEIGGFNFASYSVFGTYTQSLATDNVIRYNLTGNTKLEYSNPTYGLYNFMINAGTYSLKLGTYSNYNILSSDLTTIGSTGSGLTGSFTLQGTYDGDNMWITYKNNFINMPKVGPVGPSTLLGNMLAIDAGNATSYSGSGATWNDLSGNSNTVTLNGGYGYSSSDGGYITFNGSDAFGVATHASSLNATTGYSIEFWVNHVSGDYILAGKAPYTGGPSNQNGNYMTWLGNTYHLFISSDGGSNVNYFANYDAVANTWQQLVFTFDGTTANFYKNGVLGTTTTAAGPASLVATNEDLLIGKRKDGYGYLNGKLSIINMWNYALTGTQVLSNYNIYKTRYGL